VYLPRLPDGARVQRVGPTPPSQRNPMPGVEEVQDHLGAVETRKPRWIVVSTGYAWRFLRESHGPANGRLIPESQRMSLADVDATTHFRALWAGSGSYAAVHIGHYEGYGALLPPRGLHASLACDVWIFERR